MNKPSLRDILLREFPDVKDEIPIPPKVSQVIYEGPGRNEVITDPLILETILKYYSLTLIKLLGAGDTVHLKCDGIDNYWKGGEIAHVIQIINYYKERQSKYSGH